MSAYHLEKCCTVEDAAGISKNNMSAFWEEKWWRLLWTDGSLANRITATTARTPKNLLKDRDIRRHQMVVETATGEVVGYARWILPASHKDEWLEAQTPDVSDEDKKRFDEEFANAVFEPRDLDNMDDPIHEMQARYRPQKPHIGESAYPQHTFRRNADPKSPVLDYLGVRPDHQRRGVAGMLMASGKEQADKLGMAIFLVAMGSNAAGMYKKNGFEILEKNVQSLKEWGGEEEDLYETFSTIRHPST